MGGEKYLPCFNADGFVGSPPRWRGKAVKFRCTCGLQRITPAWAGKSKLALCTPSCPTDHPRVGGEKLRFRAVPTRELGSPPRGRGKAALTSWNGSRSRITPAWAGKSQWAMTCYSGQQGSPPRGRGKGIVGSLHHALDGITPAWAGKSIEKPFQFLSQLDHPRVGGEKPRFFDTPDDTVGSPPRGRGKVECGLQLAFHIGITPAWAGKS